MARVRLREEVISGPDAPVLLRHVLIRGSNAEIGRAIAELAIDHDGLRAEAFVADGRFVRARRTYFERNYPIHAQRMRGVAAAFGLRPDDDRFDFSILGVRAGDGVADALTGVATYSPPWTTETGHGLLRRTAKPPEKPKSLPQLYLMEWHPAGAAHASIALHGFDLLSGTVHGVNNAGLAVSAVASAGVPLTSPGLPDRRPRAVPAVGLHELGLLRFVLDTCATIDDAQAALLGARAFRMLAPARYLVADRSGRSFAYESSADGSAQRIVDGSAGPQSIASPAAHWATKAKAAECADHCPTGNVAEPLRIAETGAHEGASWWECVVDQERRSLEVRHGPNPGGVWELLGETG
jgi:hypothetical protein